MTVVSAVTVAGSYAQVSVETVTAIQMENATTSHAVRGAKHTGLPGRTTRDRAEAMPREKKCWKNKHSIFPNSSRLHS